MLTLHHKAFGQGDPVVILHGLFGTSDNWQTIGKQLADTFSVYLLDQRNHGRSPHATGLTYPLMAEDLQHFLESNWMYQTHLVGHSMGGKVAMQFALEYPDMLDKLVIVDIAPKDYVGGHELIFKALLALDLKSLKGRQQADKQLQQLGIASFGVRQFLLKNLTRNKTGGYAWKMNLFEIHKHYPDILKNIDSSGIFEGETLFIRGEASNYIQDDDWETILQQFPNARLVTIPNAGHWVHAEAPKELLTHVTDFLA
ncbi:MAG: alpha/beta fold hydrolase [Bacteroidota bacterium]